MSTGMIEHRGIVQSIQDGNVVVAMDTGSCQACEQGSSCGLGQVSGGHAATLLVLPGNGSFKVGDAVSIGLPESRMNSVAILGYLFPAIAMLIGAGLGSSFDGSDGATALGAIAGFLGALALARVFIALLPNLMPAPQLIPLSNQSRTFRQE